MKRFIQVEYDTAYYGGDYSKVGTFVLLPVHNLTDETIGDEFEKVTGKPRIHIIHYTSDELYDEHGNSVDE